MNLCAFESRLLRADVVDVKDSYVDFISTAHGRAVELEEAKKHHALGDHVKTPAGHGHVASIHTDQKFYGVHMGTGGTAYFPASQCGDPDNDHDMDMPGQPDVDAPQPTG